jgi:hypothetical protein
MFRLVIAYQKFTSELKGGPLRHGTDIYRGGKVAPVRDRSVGCPLVLAMFGLIVAGCSIDACALSGRRPRELRGRGGAASRP